MTTKPDVNIKWAESGSILEPDDAKKQLGWIAEVPTFQFMNFVLNRQDEFNAHVNEQGMPLWDAITDFPVDAFTKVGNTIYTSLQTPNINKEPTANLSTFWKIGTGSGQEKVIPQTVSGVLTAGGVLNQIRDSGTFDLPPADGFDADVILVVELPDTFKAKTPTITRDGVTDLIRNGDGTDTVISFVGAAKLTLTTNGVNEWSL